MYMKKKLFKINNGKYYISYWEKEYYLYFKDLSTNRDIFLRINDIGCIIKLLKKIKKEIEVLKIESNKL